MTTLRYKAEFSLVRYADSVKDSVKKASEYDLFLYGHTHSTDKFDAGVENAFNVCVDANGFSPVSIQEIIYLMKKKSSLQ